MFVNDIDLTWVFSSRRRKCVISTGAASCTYCIDKNIQCTKGLSPSQVRRDGEGSSSPHTPVRLSIREKEPRLAMPQQLLCIELVHLYFDLIHDQFHFLFHRPSFTEALLHGRAPPVILFAMMALSARYDPSPFRISAKFSL